MKKQKSFFNYFSFKVIFFSLIIFFFLITVPATALEIISLPVEKKEAEVYQIEANIPVLLELNHQDIQDKYNNLFRDNILTFIEYTIKMARQNQRDFAKAEFPMREFKAKVDYELKNKEEILSIKLDYYQYTGGAHGNPYSLSYNIDLATGKDLNLVDFLKRQNMTLAEVEKIIKAEIEKNSDKYFQNEYGFQNLKEDQCYYLKSGELVVYFQPYAIAPYSTGMPEFKIEY